MARSNAPQPRGSPGATIYGALRRGAVVGLAVFGLASAIGGLLTAGPLGRITLLVVALSCAAYTVAILLWSRLGGGRRVLMSELDAAREDLIVQRRQWRLERRHLLSTMMQIVDQQAQLYDEELVLVVGIGTSDSDDWIREERTTTPRGLAYFRSFRIITSDSEESRDRDYDNDLLDVSVDDSPSTTRLSLIEHDANGVRMLVLFDPPLSARTRWTVRYRVPGLWAPLRRGERDHLYYDSRSPLGSASRAQFTHFSARFVLDGWLSDHRLLVTERTGAGRFRERTPLAASWVADRGSPRRYVWDLLIASTDTASDGDQS